MTKLIAEIGINHNGDIDNVKKLITLSRICDYDYVKFQKRCPDVCIPEHQKNIMRDTPWGRMKYIDYKHRIELSHTEYLIIKDCCEEAGIEWFASVWDLESAKFMKEFCSIIKIPSALLTDLDLISYCRKNYETLIISTGMSVESEIEDAVRVGNPDVLLHCISTYPANDKELNLNYIRWLTDKYPDIEIGYSGHEYGILPSILSVLSGAKWVERHVTLNKNMWGSDQACSLEPHEVFMLAREIRMAESSLGTYGERSLADSEEIKRGSLRK